MRVLPVFLAILLVATAIAPGFAASQDNNLILRVAMQDDIRGTNPFWSSNDYWTNLVTQWLYDSPIFFKETTLTLNVWPHSITNYSLVPYIAIGSANISGKAVSWDDCAIGNFGYSPKNGWQNSSKKEAIIFYDFENVYWHDRTQMDIRDVMFSYHAAAQYPAWRGDIECLISDNYTSENWLHIDKVWENGTKAALKFTLQTPYWQFFNRTLAVRLLPEHIWANQISGQNVDAAKIWCDTGYNISGVDSWKLSLAQSYENPTPVGSGLFKWGNWTKGQFSNLFTWREHFFRGDYKYSDYILDEYGESLAVQPNIDGISFSIYKTAEAAILAMKNADIDYIAWSIPPTFIQELANEPGIALQQTPEQGFTYLAYNMQRSSFGYNVTGHDVGAPLRKAIAHLIDKNRIVTRLLHSSMGIPGQGPVSSISPWYNKTIPRYSFDPDEAKKILADAGYKVKQDGQILAGDAAIAAAGDGTWWLNPDGSPIGSSAGGLIEIQTSSVNYNPIRAQAGLMIAQQLRDIGIYAEYSPSWSWYMNNLENRNFDIYLESCKIDTDPTVFLYDFFHSKNAATGLNYAGYQNASFDATIELARFDDNESVRKQAVFEAQASICYDLPYDVLYYRTNVEAYRSDRFRGWEKDESGSIFNPRSLRAIRGPNPYKLTAQFVNLPSAMVSNSTTPVTIMVKDQEGNPMEGAQVWLNASTGKLAQEVGFTNTAGKFTTAYTASYVDPFDTANVANGTQVIIQIKEAKFTDANQCEYDDAPSQLALMKVFPKDAPFISVMMSADPDIIDPDTTADGTLGFTFVVVEVRNQNGDAVAGASVAMSASPAVPKIEPESQLTDADGKARFKVTATDLPDNDGSEVQYVLKAMAIHPDDSKIQGANSCSLSVVDTSIYFENSQNTIVEWEMLIISVLIIIVMPTSIAFLFIWSDGDFAGWWRKRP